MFNTNTTERMKKYSRQIGEYESEPSAPADVAHLMQEVLGDSAEFDSTKMGRNRFSPLSIYITNEYCKEYGLSLKDIYSINSEGLRSDEFKSDHEGKHIVFAGCSITLGEGVPLEHTWAHMTYQKIASTEKVSGYYNIAQSGSSSNWILIQALKYINFYGVPDVMFINFPEASRELGYLENKELAQDMTTNLYAVLSARIKQAGGRIVSFSWDTAVSYGGQEQAIPEDARLHMADFYRYHEVEEKQRSMFLFKEDYKKTGTFVDNFVMFAMDDGHPGLAEHNFYANFAYNIYIGEGIK